MNNFFSSNLKFLRNNLNMTQSELANRMNKDYSTIGKWELGQRNPTMEDMLRLSDIFNVNVQDFVDKDLRIKENNILSEFDLLFDKHKDILSESDKNIIKAIIEQRKKEIDREQGNG
ncbi:MAG: helix-turn-helix transcriptional regulator [Bacilli bacterium]|nr:helix-turn-helix transcriptional regulator [Bacilli bacterium]